MLNKIIFNKTIFIIILDIKLIFNKTTVLNINFKQIDIKNNHNMKLYKY